MAPIDRREHRQQRVRGAGPSSVQASFGFNFGALGARPAKQSSLPPQLSSRRTPVQSTPRSQKGSAQRRRSASVQRSGNSRPKSTPTGRTVTPQIGKRKRGSPNALPSADDGGEDELSPGREETDRSIEKSRRVVGTVSPIREELDDVPDELSVLEDGRSTARKTTMDASAVAKATPVSVLTHKRVPSTTLPARTPIADRVGSMQVTSRQAIPRRSKSSEPGPATPGMLPNGRLGASSASRLDSQFDTPGTGLVGDESEDELSPPQAHQSTPRVVGKEQESVAHARDDTQLDVDELSPVQPTQTQAISAQNTPVVREGARVQESSTNHVVGSTLAASQVKRGRPRKIVLDEQDYATHEPAPAKPTNRGWPANIAAAEASPRIANSVVSRSKRKRKDVATEDEQADGFSPDKGRTVTSKRPARRERDAIDVKNGGQSDEHEQPEQEEELQEEHEPTSQPTKKRHSPNRSKHIKPTSEKPSRKRHIFLGPKHAISVMRIKGSTVRGITVADTTRTILEETIDHRLNRMAEKMQTVQDSTRRKELRSEINMFLSFKESLNEKLLDLQDANDLLSTNFKKLKLFKRDNTELRKDILALQNNKQEVALEHDDVQAEYDAEKEKIDARNKLSDDMFDIEAAIQNGRRKARKEGREDEGPKIPLSMMLGMVGRDVGSYGGGLLSNIKTFNGALERAAGWLEGRA